MEYEVIVRFRVKAENAEAASDAVNNYLSDVVDREVLEMQDIHNDDATPVEN